MAAVTTRGLHRPIGLPYLIAEGILPQDPKKELYKWDTHVVDNGDGLVDEEVLVTKTCVVWSQGNVVRAVYRFELEGEDVAQAVLTTFPNRQSKPTESPGDSEAAVNDPSPRMRTPRQPPSRVSSYIQPNAADTNERARALVVILQTKAHVYLLSGSHHIVDLPFRINRAFPSPYGLVLQRMIAHPPSPPTTPTVPSVPPNSFFSSQPTLSSSLLQSPSLRRTFASSQSTHPTQSGDGEAWLNTLWHNVQTSPGTKEQLEGAAIFTLTDPLSELGLLTESMQRPKLRISGKSQHGSNIDFEALDTDEQIVYVSAKDELSLGSSCDSSRRGQLMLLVTINRDLRYVTLWHAWYTSGKSLAGLMKQRAEVKAEKARRRSSFLSASMGTGATTPAVRNRDGARESFAAASQLPNLSSRKPTKQEEEAAMASQLDPDFHPDSSQQSRKDGSRRISSLVARSDLVANETRGIQSNVASSFGVSSRRNTSFGVPSERRSFGPRKSRGSTPGSILSRSIGPDDESGMDLDSEMAFENDDAVDEIIAHIRATYEAAGAECIFGTPDEGWKRDIVVRKIHAFALGPTATSADAMKIVTLRTPTYSAKSEDGELCIYLHDQTNRDLYIIKLMVKQEPLWRDRHETPFVAIPLVKHHVKEGAPSDVIRISDNGSEAVLLGGRELRFASTASAQCKMPPPAPYRVHDPVLIPWHLQQAHSSEGKNRVLSSPSGALLLTHPGVAGAFDEVDGDGRHHRRMLQLGPRDEFIREILDVCELVLPSDAAALVRSTWCTLYANLCGRPELLSGTACSREWIATAATISSLVLDLIDQKTRAALRVSRIASGNRRALKSGTLRLHQRQHLEALLAKPAWTALATTTPSSKVTKDSLRATTNRDQAIPIAVSLADELPYGPTLRSPGQEVNRATKLMLALHILHEERKLHLTCPSLRYHASLPPIIAQLGSWLRLDAWSPHPGNHYAFEGASESRWAYAETKTAIRASVEIMERPIGVLEWLEHAVKHKSSEQYPSLSTLIQYGDLDGLPSSLAQASTGHTPRIVLLSRILKDTHGLTESPVLTVETMAKHGMTSDVLEALPEGVAAPFREAVAQCERRPPAFWTGDLLRLVGREDLGQATPSVTPAITSTLLRDVQAICHAVEQPLHATKTREAGRNAVSQLIFSEDRRLLHATSLMHFNSMQVAECPKQPDWTDAHHFEQQRRLMQFVTIRMIALPAGDGMLHYDSQAPLMTEKYHLPGFNSSCIMQPMGHTVTTDRSGLTEEKVNWAYFHAGVSTGLRISRGAKGIDTSWLVFNKPNEPTNRHAGLLLALGLNGHLRNLAKWLSFKYLTPKHTMTSVGLLLGISASYLGSMDGLITRMLSVHITSMLPPGAAELNVSPLTQTAGLMGIGLLYYNTQHRRMSEIMLQEIETMDVEDPDGGPDVFRDESYRLAAGFALGFINLAHGRDLRGLHGMQLPERLLRIAVGPRPVHAVHVFDKATAGAIIATALVYMKTGDVTLARKIDVPDTETQFEHVRPDMLMLRSMAKHVILWDSIKAASEEFDGPTAAVWIPNNLPACCKPKWQELQTPQAMLSSYNVPFYHIVTGLAWALSLKYAGTGSKSARNEILAAIDLFWGLSKKRGDGHYYYDAKVARSCIRRCIDVLSLSVATVMAGTGDLQTFRYLRRLHGRTDAETPYGSHLAAHMGIGMLFLGGGTYTLGTSNMATAALICSLYPLFPTDVHDNRVHLQAFRHLWVFAVDSRCLVVEDIDTRRPIHMPITVMMRDQSTLFLRAPCLLPDVAGIVSISTADPAYWRVKLHFAVNAQHLSLFRTNQTIFVRRCPATEAHDSTFWATFFALSDSASRQQASSTICSWLFSLNALKDLDQTDIEFILPPDERSSVCVKGTGTRVDDRLVLKSSAKSTDRDRLWDLRVLFAWATRAADEGQSRTRWIGRQFVQALECAIDERRQVLAQS